MELGENSYLNSSTVELLSKSEKSKEEDLDMNSVEMSSETECILKENKNEKNANEDDKNFLDENDSIHETLFKSKPNEENTSVNKTKDSFIENDKKKTGRNEALLDNSNNEFSVEENGSMMCKNNTDTNLSLYNNLHEAEKGETKFSESKEEINEKLQLDHKEICNDDDTICGIGSFRPKWLQKYATPKVYLFLYSVIGVIQGTYYNYFVAILSTLEKRFSFNTKTMGGIMLVEEITPLFLSIPFGYIGGKTHRPRLVALGLIMYAVCCFLTAFPFMIYGPAKRLSIQEIKNETSNEVCDELRMDDCGLDEKSSTVLVVALLIISFFLKGFSNISYPVVGLSYMDDSAKKKNSPLYLAVVLTLRYVGPLLGYLMSSICLKFNENPFEDPGFGPEDPRWIGAWWMGFILQGTLMVICTIPMALFPRRLPGHKKLERKDSSAKKDNWREIFLGLVDALKRLTKNPFFVLMAVSVVLMIFGHLGHFMMLPKYMENQFKLSAADASLYSGATSVTCMMVSTVFGGLLIWKFKPSAKILLAGMMTSEIIMVFGYLILMIPKCQTAEMLNFGQNDQGLILNGQCNQNCYCSTTAFTPFCGQDGKTTYFSPCYAGCKDQPTLFMSNSEKKAFGNCSCVTDEVGLTAGTITEGFCVDEDCWTQTLAYLCVLLFLIIISNVFTVANTMVILRSVHPSDKSVALGTFETLCCLFGFIPFPIIFGSIVDSACLVWEKTCDKTGNCWFYDMDNYRFLLHGVSSLFCALSVFCVIGMFCFRARLERLYEDEEEEDVEEPTAIKLDPVSGSVTKL